MPEADRSAGCDLLLRKLGNLAALSADEADAVLRLGMTVEAYPAGTALLRDGDKPPCFHLLLDGFACRHKSLADDARQVLSFHTPGDILDLQSLYLESVDYGVSIVVPAVVGRIPRHALHELTRAHPGIARAFWRDTLVDAAIYREWMLGLGRRSSRSHLAHMLCEIVTRLSVVSAATGTTLDTMPLRPNDLADALGLTVVEVNRLLHGFLRDGLIDLGPAGVTVLGFDALAGICDFDPGYLHADRAA